MTIGMDEEKRIADRLETNAYEISFAELTLETGVPKRCIVPLPEQGQAGVAHDEQVDETSPHGGEHD